MHANLDHANIKVGVFEIRKDFDADAVENIMDRLAPVSMVPF